MNSSGSPTLRPDPMRVTKVHMHVDEVKAMSPADRFNHVRDAMNEGYDWVHAYEHIRQSIDPMDVLSDTQIFGVEIPWGIWPRK